jgi:hypothetical protein
VAGPLRVMELNHLPLLPILPQPDIKTKPRFQFIWRRKAKVNP